MVTNEQGDTSLVLMARNDQHASSSAPRASLRLWPRQVPQTQDPPWGGFKNTAAQSMCQGWQTSVRGGVQQRNSAVKHSMKLMSLLPLLGALRVDTSSAAQQKLAQMQRGEIQQLR